MVTSIVYSVLWCEPGFGLLEPLSDLKLTLLIRPGNRLPVFDLSPDPVSTCSEESYFRFQKERFFTFFRGHLS